MPLACGGGIRTLQDAEARISGGADKIVVNSLLFNDPKLVKGMVTEFGSQCVIGSIDVLEANSDYTIFVDHGSQKISMGLCEAVSIIQDLGVGEIFLNSISRDGSKAGFDPTLIDYVASMVDIPLIVCGGAGTETDFEFALKRPGVDAVAAANYFQHTELSVYRLHSYLVQVGCNVRPPRHLKLGEMK